MGNSDLGKRFFTNTYITGSGRQNYLGIKDLEDPLFTSFTLDIDYVTSPLFYTINYSDYGYPNVEGMAENIEAALKYMYENEISIDEGYEILPLLSASILDGNKLGFGLQQNVFMDMPLYGAAEYIYMVDKRNGGADQNDARFDSNKFVEYGGNPNALNGYKLGDSVKTIVNDSDKAWAERKQEQNKEQVNVCNEILNDPSVKSEHQSNKSDMDAALLECNQNNKVTVDGKEYTENELKQKIDELKNKDDVFEQFKREIVDWANGEISQYQNKVTSAYTSNKCVQKIATYEDISFCSNDQKEIYIKELKTLYGDNYVKEHIYDGNNSYMKKIISIYNELETYTGSSWSSFAKKDDGKSFLLETERSDGRATIRQKKVIDKFGDKLEYFGLYKKGDSSFTGKIQAVTQKTQPDWMLKLNTALPSFVNESDIIEMSNTLMAFQCDISTSFLEFGSETTTNNDTELAKYQSALDNLRTGLYGYTNGAPCEMSNADPNSPYGRYIAAKEKYENDEYSQAEKAKSLAQSGVNEMSNMITSDEYIQGEMDKNYNKSVQSSAQPLEVSRSNSPVVSQTVLDMLGFISGMKKMTMHYPYIIQGVTGLDTAYNKHYGIKDPYLGSGDDKITLTCLESLDLRVSSMFNRYFNAVYDRQYRRERVPVNLRRFNCSIYVHDVRNFISRNRIDNNGNHQSTYNRILELTDMYHSVIEFRFFDCEIVPEETGNIFDNISNEAPSEMKKTNFTFTYGNCVVNFVPPSEVASHNSTN